MNYESQLTLESKTRPGTAFTIKRMSFARRLELTKSLRELLSRIEFLEAGKKRLVGDTSREATAPEVTDLRKENTRLKQLVAEMVLENRLLKKTVTASDWGDEACD